MPEYRSDIFANKLPRRMLGLPVQNGYPVPWFVAFIKGAYDFRCADERKIPVAVEQNLCWCCGQGQGNRYAFAIGPMCVINRVTNEPPSHRDCATWSAIACPFLTQKQLVRREHDLPVDYKDPAGIAILRQPGVTCVYVTRSYQPFQVKNGVLFDIGEPIEVLWYRKGRLATRAEVEESIATGWPDLMALAKKDGPDAIAGLEERRARAMELLPKPEEENEQ